MDASHVPAARARGTWLLAAAARRPTPPHAAQRGHTFTIDLFPPTMRNFPWMALVFSLSMLLLFLLRIKMILILKMAGALQHGAT